MLVIGSDVEALYPSLEDRQVAEICFRAVMETKIKFENVDYEEGVRYVPLNLSADQCRMSELRRVLPWRKKVKGTRRGVTGVGPKGAERGDENQLEFPKVCLTEHEKRLIIATVVQI